MPDADLGESDSDVSLTDTEWAQLQYDESVQQYWQHAEFDDLSQKFAPPLDVLMCDSY